MQTYYGRIIAINDLLRIVTIETRRRHINVYIQRAQYNRFSKYLILDNRVLCTVKTRSNPTKKHYLHTLIDFLKIVRPTPRTTKILYSQNRLESQTRTFINTLKTKMFLDLELSMHPYRVQKDFLQEIIQVGYILVDEKDHILGKYMAFIRPSRHKTLTKRTLKFLDLTQEDVDQGIDYHNFYAHFKSVLKTYDPAIIVWGKNDHLSLKSSYQANDVDDLTPMSRIVNLLQLHKNVYRLKDDIGLTSAYKMYGHTINVQRHDALEDAMMTMHIFEGFKEVLNNIGTFDKSMLKKYR